MIKLKICRICFCCLAALWFIAGFAFSKTSVQYTKEITNDSKNLEELQKNIKEKRLEKEKCLLDEKCIRSELAGIDRELRRLEKKGESIKKDVKKAEKMLNQSVNELKLAGWEKSQWQNALNSELNKWYQANHAYYQLFRDRVNEHLRFEAMSQKKSYFDSARNKESLSRQAILKWQMAQNKLKELKLQQEKTLEEQAGVKGRKKEILQTTIGRRIAAENEINKLTETSKALEQLIIKLEKEKKKTEQEAMEKARFKQKKKHLPWPVAGEIIVKFGRNKHPEFDTYIISNGIKIKAAANSDVKAVCKGEVIFCGEFRSYGQMVLLDHGGGFYTIYGQLNEILVTEDQKVQEASVIGRLGNAPQPALYFEVRSENKVEDPELWLK